MSKQQTGTRRFISGVVEGEQTGTRDPNWNHQEPCGGPAGVSWYKQDVNIYIRLRLIADTF